MRNRALLFSLLLCSCTMGPDYEPVFPTMPDRWPWETEAPAAPSAEPNGPEVPPAIAADWWKNFQDPALTRLIEEGLTANADLLTAAARLEEARALLSYRISDQYPELNIQGSATRTSNSRKSRIGAFNFVSKPYNIFSLAPVLNYEIDIWGRLRRASESARAQMLAEQANRDAIRLAVAADIANAYFTLRALDAQVAITDNTIKAYDEVYRYQDAQYRYGAVNGLVLNQAAAELANARALGAELDQARQQQATALGVLLGRSPEALTSAFIERGGEVDALPVPPALAADAPSTLLKRRPDIQAAEQRVVSANAEIGAAIADYFPTLSLSTLYGHEATELNDLLRASARRWQLGGALADSLYSFGRGEAGVNIAEAQKEETLIAYQQTIRSAFKDVLDAMAATKTAATRTEAEDAQTSARGEALRLSQLRYDAGYSNYLEVLDSQRTLYQAQLDRITARRDRLSASVNLYKALGGGWPGVAQTTP